MKESGNFFVKLLLVTRNEEQPQFKVTRNEEQPQFKTEHPSLTCLKELHQNQKHRGFGKTTPHGIICRRGENPKERANEGPEVEGVWERRKGGLWLGERGRPDGLME